MSTLAEYDWRPIDAAQAGQWADLLAAIESTDHADEAWSESDLLDEIADPGYDFGRGSVAIYDGQAMVGFCSLAPQVAVSDAHRMEMNGGVRPAYRDRGIGSWLLGWAERAAIPLHLDRHPDLSLSVVGRCLARNADAMALFSEHGYQQSRWFHRMSADLRAGRPSCQVPDDVTVTPLTQERWPDGLTVRNEAFLDHWGSAPTTPEVWEHFLRDTAFRPAYSLLAYAGSEPLGIVVGYEFEAYTSASGRRDLYIPLVATRRTGRGRGIASALLARVLAAAGADGFVTASLEVDADSPTGAVQLYQRLGFAVIHTSVAQTKAVLPADP